MIAREETLEVIKKLISIYYGCEDEYYINLAMSEIDRGFTIADVIEMMEHSEL